MNFQVKAKELAEKLEVKASFKTPCVRKNIRQFNYEANDETIIDPQEHFKVEFFIPLVDTANMALQERFEQLKAKISKVEFLFEIDKLPKREDLLVKCKELEDLLSDENGSDIKGAELCEELISMKDFMPNKGRKTPVHMLNFLLEAGTTEAGVNMWVALRILRSFSKLKLIKTYLWSTLSQERLNNLAFLSIENDISSSLDYNDLISTFSAAKARKINL